MRSFRRVGTGMVVSAVAAAAVTLVPAPAVQAAATAQTIQVTSVGSVPVATTGTGPVGRVTASCPAGTFAVGGGDDPTLPANPQDRVVLISDGPTAGGQGLDAFKTATMPTPDGWEVIASNIGPDPVPVTVTVVCEPTTGGNIGSVVVVTKAGIGQFDADVDVTTSCPGSDEALSGGIDTDSQTAADHFILGSAPSGDGTPVGWHVQMLAAAAGGLGYVAGVICTDPSQGIGGPPTLGVPSVSSNEAPIASQGFTTVTTPTCPAGDEAVGAGVIDPSNSHATEISALTPLQAGGARPSTTPPGTYPAATQWSATVDNIANAIAATPPLSVTVSVICVPPPGSGGGGGGTGGTSKRNVTRLAGTDRDSTAIAVSQNAFPAPGSAKAVVLSRNDSFADALAGTPLAVHADGPLLLTPPPALDPATQQEIVRVLPPGGTVFLLGGTSAISQGVADTLTGLGFTVTRIAGQDRFDTAVKIAEQLGNPATVIEATGINFPDALAAGAAAGAQGDALLLTIDSTQAPETAAYLSAHPADKRIAVGGQAAAADPGATPIVGIDRYDTAAKVATTLFGPTPATFGAALGTNFPDALAGGARSGLANEPLLLVTTSAPLPAATASYLAAVNPTSGIVYGGASAVDDTTLTALENT